MGIRLVHGRKGTEAGISIIRSPARPIIYTRQPPLATGSFSALNARMHIKGKQRAHYAQSAKPFLVLPACPRVFRILDHFQKSRGPRGAGLRYSLLTVQHCERITGHPETKHLAVTA
jgi:hypothetical protein